MLLLIVISFLICATQISSDNGPMGRLRYSLDPNVQPQMPLSGNRMERVYEALSSHTRSSYVDPRVVQDSWILMISRMSDLLKFEVSLIQKWFEEIKKDSAISSECSGSLFKLFWNAKSGSTYALKSELSIILSRYTN